MSSPYQGKSGADEADRPGYMYNMAVYPVKSNLVLVITLPLEL